MFVIFSGFSDCVVAHHSLQQIYLSLGLPWRDALKDCEEREMT